MDEDEVLIDQDILDELEDVNGDWPFDVEDEDGLLTDEDYLVDDEFSYN